jgi:hypothetical protein
MQLLDLFALLLVLLPGSVRRGTAEFHEVESVARLERVDLRLRFGPLRKVDLDGPFADGTHVLAADHRRRPRLDPEADMRGVPGGGAADQPAWRSRWMICSALCCLVTERPR